MCLCKDNADAVKVKTPKSPWRRLFREPKKPKLSRRIVAGPRINLNLYWSKFEEIHSIKPPQIVLNDNEINENLMNEMREFGL